LVVQQPDEVEWVCRARAGDREAFAVLVDRYWDRLRRWLFGLTGHAQLAEDLTQEAFVRAWSALPQLHAEATFRVWLFRIARNCLLDARRGPRGTAPRPLPGDLHGKEPGPLRELLEREGQEMLQAALARLPDPYRAAYLLWAQEGLPYCQLAEVLQTTEETARWRVCKARQFLLHQLQAYLDMGKP
jgi:RNA polymerase sigma-70 factor, ECF subfamily